MTSAEQMLIDTDRKLLALTGYVKDEEIKNKIYDVSDEIMNQLYKFKSNK
ncbi:hypothetical protein [Priestia megaterium]|nr:hypothetical protein [Priestia megaterium]